MDLLTQEDAAYTPSLQLAGRCFGAFLRAYTSWMAVLPCCSSALTAAWHCRGAAAAAPARNWMRRTPTSNPTSARPAHTARENI